MGGGLPGTNWTAMLTVVGRSGTCPIDTAASDSAQRGPWRLPVLEPAKRTSP
jgi:hypothetical protein